MPVRAAWRFIPDHCCSEMMSGTLADCSGISVLGRLPHQQDAERAAREVGSADLPTLGAELVQLAGDAGMVGGRDPDILVFERGAGIGRFLFLRLGFGCRWRAFGRWRLGRWCWRFLGGWCGFLGFAHGIAPRLSRRPHP